MEADQMTQDAGPSWRSRAGTGAVAFALVLAWLWAQPPLAPWGDALRFVDEAASIADLSLFGNHIGQRIGLHLVVPIGEALGLTPERAAVWLSMLGMAFGLGLAAATARALGATPRACVGWSLVAAASPSVTLLGPLTEVHGVQLAASALALWILVRSRERSSSARWSFAALALGVAVVGHTSQILLAAPFFAYVVLRRGKLAHVASAAVVCVAITGALGWVAMDFFARVGPDGYEGTWRPLYVLGRYSSIVLDMRERSGWFGPLDVLDFTWIEVLATGGLVWIAVAGAFGARRERSHLALPIGLAVYLIVLSQVGIHERGAYFLALFPLLVVVGSKLPANLPFALLVVQIPLGLAASLEDSERADARDWARGIEHLVRSGEMTLPMTIETADMVRQSAFPTVPDVVVGRMWYYQFEWVPPAAWDAVIAVDLGAELDADLARGRVFFDADVLPEDGGTGARWQRFTDAFLEARGLERRAIPWPTELGPPPTADLADRFLFEVVRPTEGAPAGE
ncbi:glycosyltransferase family 39 protein [Planctomycetes bacterium Pla163]